MNFLQIYNILSKMPLQVISAPRPYWEKFTPDPPEIGGLPIIAWRAWKIKTFCLESIPPLQNELFKRYSFHNLEQPLLMSYSAGVIWPCKKVRMEAICHRLDSELKPFVHLTPDPNCYCGIWAMKKEVMLPLASVWGKVALWGRIIECQYGYRAQYAYPVELWSRYPEETLEKLSDAYEVPVHCEEFSRSV